MNTLRRHLAVLIVATPLVSWTSATLAEDPTPPSAGAGATTSKPADRPAGVPSIAGRWYSYYGIMEFEEHDGEFRGTYGCCEGKLTASYEGPRVNFKWQDKIYGEGWGYFFFEGDGSELRGLWGEKNDMGESGEWGAVRILEPHYLDPEYPGDVLRFAVETEHQRFGPMFDGEIELAIDGKLAEGRLEGYYMTDSYELPFRVDVFLLIDGTVDGDTYKLEWEDPRYGHYGEIRVQPDGEQLAGEWEEYATVQKSAITLTPAAGS